MKLIENQTFDEDGRKITAKDPTMLEGWLNVALDKQAWYDKSYKDNKDLQGGNE